MKKVLFLLLLIPLLGSMPQEDRGVFTPLTRDDLVHRDGTIYYVRWQGNEYLCYESFTLMRRKCARVVEVDLDNPPHKEGTLPHDLQRWQQTEEMLKDRVILDEAFPKGPSPYSPNQGCPYTDIHRCNEDIAE